MGRMDRDDRRGGEEQKRKYTKFRKDNRCRFCRGHVDQVDYKDVNTLIKLCTGQGKLSSRRRSGNCMYHQRSAKRAIKRARYVALVPFVGSAQ